MKNLKAEIGKIKEYLPHKTPEKKPGVASRLFHDLGLAVWFGGSLMGILAVNPAVEVLDDPEERGKMVDEAWARFQPYGALGLLTAFVTQIAMRRRGPHHPTPTYTTAAIVQDVALVGACASSLAALALGEYTVNTDPDTYTPIEQATEPSSDTPEDVATAQAGLSLAAWGQIVSGVVLFICAAVLVVERDKSR